MSSGHVGGNLGGQPGSGHAGRVLERLVRRGQGTLSSLEPLTPSRYAPTTGTLRDAAAPGTAVPGSGGLDDDILEGDAVAANAEADNHTGQVARPVPAMPAVRGRRRRGLPAAPAGGTVPAGTAAPTGTVAQADTVRVASMAGVADKVSTAGAASPAGAVASAGAVATAGMPSAVDVVSGAASLAGGGRPGGTIIGVTGLAASVPAGVAELGTAAGAQAADAPPVTAERAGHEITITIGHIEVRAATPAASEPAARPPRPEFQPRMSLADFLGEHGTGHR